MSIAVIITNAGRSLYRDSVKGGASPQVTFVALGTSNTAPTLSDTKLGSESFRKAIPSTANTNGTLPGETLTNITIAAGEAVGLAIQEIGFFGGAAATATANTGVLIGRALYAHNKTSSETLTFQFDCTIS